MIEVVACSQPLHSALLCVNQGQDCLHEGVAPDHQLKYGSEVERCFTSDEGRSSDVGAGGAPSCKGRLGGGAEPKREASANEVTSVGGSESPREGGRGHP